MIVLTVTESVNELISGFPEYIIFETSQPATVFYTLDGTAPGISSLIAVDKVYLPTGGGTLVVKAKAVAGLLESDILELEYKTTNSTINGPRLTGTEGISVLRFGSEVVDSLSYDSSGNAAQETSIEFDNLSIKASREDYQGIRLDPFATSVDFINFADATPKTNITERTSPNGPGYFDPNAKVIVIDGSTSEKMEEQVVKIVNRPYNTFGPTTNFYTERLGQKEPIITGNYVRSFYNPKTNQYISYYWESLESRWIQSIQTVDIPSRNLSGPFPRNQFVIRWINDRSQSLFLS
jgi:hypothetical protein